MALQEHISLRELLNRHTGPAAPELIRQEDNGRIQCLACGHRCRIGVGKAGVCQVRFNEGGELRVPRGYVASLAADPIEKKPFFHAYPGRDALSFGMLGCDLHCSYCQNWITSQALRDDEAVAAPRFIEPDEIVRLALAHDCPVITSTYNEPLITSEWAVEIMRLGSEHGLAGAYVSNGNATPEVLEYLRPWVSLYKIDLKAYHDVTYRRLGCKAETVRETIRHAHGLGYWVEVVTLVVPDLNDSDDELRQMADFLASVSPDIPWHVTAFHPDYKHTTAGRTPAGTLARARAAGQAAGLRYVYSGNLPGHVDGGEDTRCPSCGTTLIRRHGFTVRENRVTGGQCPNCSTTIPGVWE